MKKRLLMTGVVVLVLGVGAYPSVARWRENQRQAEIDAPQSERALRVPTEAQLRAALPGKARDVFENASSLALYAVNPRAYDYDFRAGETFRSFHDHHILGGVNLSGAKADALRASFYDGMVLRRDQGNLKRLGCFTPRHAVRAVKDNHTLDLLICFSCGNFKAWLNGKHLDTNGSINSAPQDTFNRFLTDANIPLAK